MKKYTIVAISILICIITVIIFYNQKVYYQKAVIQEYTTYLNFIKSSASDIATISNDLLENWENYEDGDKILRLSHIYGQLNSVENSTYLLKNGSYYFKDFDGDGSLNFISNFFFSYQYAFVELMINFYQGDADTEVKEELQQIMVDMETLNFIFNKNHVEEKTFSELKELWRDIKEEMIYTKAIKRYEREMARPY